MNTDENQNDLHNQLRDAVERSANRKMLTPRDFEYLSHVIYRATHEEINSFTLKRYWGYIERGGVSHKTLDLLSRYIGYGGWEQFCAHTLTRGSESGFIENQQLYASELTPGDCLRLQWQPDRELLVRYEGDERFTITEASNSKLKAGTTFRCPLLIHGDMMVLAEVVQDSETPRSFRCGKGFSFEQL